MNWAIGQGYMGLNQTTNRRESARQELGVLSMLDKQMTADAQQKEQAQLKEQAYQEQISKFSDQLLQPDRDRINAKANILSSRVREHVKKYGGNMQKFFENGGHRVMADYKNSVINSEESSQYLENKKNMDRIVALQQAGKGHLINPTDLARMKNYQENKGGEITYTGMLNEIDMPDANAYDFGTDVPPADILNNKDNRIKILGNYKLSYPEAGEPEEAELINYVRNNYNLKGKEWRRQLALENARTARINAIKESKTAKDQKPQNGPGATGYKSQYTSDVSRLIANTPERITAKEFKQGWWDKDFGYGQQLRQVTKGDFISSAEDFAQDGDGEFWDIGWAVTGYSPRNAKVLNYRKNDDTINELAGNRFKVENGTLRDVKIDNSMDWFDPSGKQIKNWDDKWLGSDHDYILNEEAKDFKMREFVTIAVAKDKDGKEHMIMNAVKSGSNDIDEETTDKMDDQLGDSEIKHMSAMVIEAEDGHRFYVPFDPTDSHTQSILDTYDEANDTTDEKQSEYQRYEEQNIVKQQTNQSKAQAELLWENINTDDEIAKSIYAESNGVGPLNNPTYRSDFIKSFYGAFMQNQGVEMEDANNYYRESSEEQLFTQMLEGIVKDGYNEIQDDLANPKIGDQQILQKIAKFDPAQESFYNQWLSNYDYLSNKKQ